MKRFIIFILTFGIVLSVSAENMWFKAHSGAYKYGNEEWSDWQECNIKILANDDGIKVYSETPQTYMHLYDLDNPSDDVYGFRMVNDDGVYCDIKFRFERSGNIQMYIFYSNVAIVYNITRIQ